MKILGISPFHDSSVCLLENGEIIEFYKEERLTNVKRDKDPIRSLIAILEKYKNQIDFMCWCTPTENLEYFNTYQKIVKKYNPQISVIDFTNFHHLTHASLAFYNSGFESASVIVIDRNGSIFAQSCRESESIFHFSYPAEIETLYKNFWMYDNAASERLENLKLSNLDTEIESRSMYGIVKVYESATSLIMQNALENGKTMGLAAYGVDSESADKFFAFDHIPNDYIFSHTPIYDNRATINIKLHKYATKNINESNYKIYADYAYQVQKQTQIAASSLIKKAIEKTNTKNICITGGYGLNVVANNFFIKEFPNINFYFEPIADDSGNSIGGAMLHYRRITGNSNIKKLQHTFFHGIHYNLPNTEGDPVTISDIAKYILNNKSIGVYFGKAEAGPRALGHRSILFNATNPDAKKIINIIKQREWYRPFAVSILEEDVEEYFEMLNIKNNSFMTISFNAKQKAFEKIPGVIHVDGTCRIQTVNSDIPHFYDLLLNIKKQCGVGAVLNTSFNLAGEALVNSPEDAISVLHRSDLDYLWFPENNVLLH